MEQYGVDVVLTGHSHNYERTWLLKGHYGDAASFNFTHQVNAASGKISDSAPYVKYTTGPNANQGTVYVVCGNGGSSTSGQPLNHPAMYFSQQDSVGFMTIDVNGLQLDAKYFDRNGIMWDNFTIQKTAQNPNGQLALKDVVKELKIYPNPFRNFLQMEYTIDTQQQLTIEMFDINGKLIQQLFNGIAKEGKNQHTALTDGLAKGNYLVKIKSSKLGELSRVVTLQ